MTKDQLQKELKEKLKEGVKPSELKKLKRSKSDGELPSNRSSLGNERHIPKAPPLPKTNPREIEELQAEKQLFSDQLKEKQKEIEELRKTLEAKNTELKATKKDLDNSLQARVTAISTFGKEHQKRTQAQKELNQTLEEASEELITSDKTISSLRTKLFKAEQEHNRLKQELKALRSKESFQTSSTEEPWITWPSSFNLIFLALIALLILTPYYD